MIYFLDPPSTGLYFKINGIIHLPGDIINIFDIGPQPADHRDPGSTLVCVTTNVNIACCRDTDNPHNVCHGGAVGNWYYPDGTTIPNASNDTAVALARFQYTHQLRLGRVTSGSILPGEYMCEIPTSITGVPIIATITINNGN